MSQRGKPSTAHVYDARDCCIYCGMYRVNVEKLNHDCKSWREAEQDKADAVAAAQANLTEAEANDHGE